MDTLPRTLPTTRRVLGDVDPAQPLDPTSSLTDGLQGFWLPLPHLTGGSRIYDLSPRAGHGDLVDGTNDPAPSWFTGAYSDFSALDFSENDDLSDSGGGYVDLPLSPIEAIIETGKYTAATAVLGIDIITGGAIGILGGATNQNGLGDDNSIIDLTISDSSAGNPNKITSTSDSFNGTAVRIDYNVGERLQVATTYDGSTIKIFKNGELGESAPFGDDLTQRSVPPIHRLGRLNDDQRYYNGEIYVWAVWNRALSDKEVAQWSRQFRYGFPDLLRRRDSVGLLGGGGGPGLISGTAAITDAQEQINATGQTEVSGTLSVTDESETLTINGATKVSGTASITDAVESVLASGTADVQGAVALTDSGEIITASGTVITTGTLSITDSGEIISAVSSLQDITGTAQITDAGEQIDATGEVKIAGTATLNDGTEEVVIIGENDISGAVSFTDLAAQIAAEGAVEVQGSLALTDLGESITARERVPARLARVNVRLEDIIVVHATLEDALTVDAKLTD